MKKIPKNKRESVKSLQTSRTERNLIRKSKHYDPNKVPSPPKVLGFRTLKVPRIFQFDSITEYKQIVKLLDDISKWSYNDKVALDFSECEHAHVQALIVLHAHLHRLRDRADRKLIRINQATLHGDAKTLVRASGIVEMLLRQEPTNTKVTSYQLPILTGGGADTPPHDQIIDHIQSRIPTGISLEMERVLGDALSEAFLNVEDHAYPEDQLPNLHLDDQRWWAICSVFDKQLFLAVYDMGVGIPQTIDTDHWLIRRAKKAIPLNIIDDILSSDSKTIGIAMQAGKNRRSEEKHGQGSISMHELVEQNPDGELWVLSGSGRYHWYHEGNTTKHELRDYPNSIPGTLVQWNVKVE